MKKTIIYVKKCISKPKIFSTVSPSSRSLSVNLVRNSDLSNAERVVELGTGLGGVTEYILKYLKNNSSYMGIDLDSDNVSSIQESYPSNTFLQGSVFDLYNILENEGVKPDRIISGLPWSWFNETQQEKGLDNVVSSLVENGIFSGYLYKPNFNVRNVKNFNGLLKERFYEVRSSGLIIKNLPPAVIYAARK